MDPILQKFRDKFYEEASGLLDKLENDLLELEKKSDDKELIESAFRVMHTIKGVSGMYGFDFICEFTHSMESIYQSIRENKLKFDKEIFDITFLSVDHLRKLLSDEKMTIPENQANHNQLLADINGVLKKATKDELQQTKIQTKKASEDAELATWHILLRADEMIYFRGISLVGIFRDLSQLGSFQISRLDMLSDEKVDTWSIILSTNSSENEILDLFLFIEDNCTITRLSGGNLFVTRETLLATVENDDENGEQSILEYVENSSKTVDIATRFEDNSVKEKAKKAVAEVVQGEKQSVKRISVDSTKLDHLMYLVSELITVNSQLNINTREKSYDPIRQQLEKVDNLSKQFRNNALEIRLVPLSDTVLRFQRLIRDLSKQLGKKINLVTQGVDTELDKNTIDQLNEPLMHIIRNCIDHGIESPAQRLAKGKTEFGSITLSAFHSGNFVIIKVEDDGMGIDCEKVRLKAVEKGLLKPNSVPTKREIFDLIFLPGFSTAQSLTEVSGRGVGMDVVKKKIIDLRGDVIVDSIEGEGTSFTLKLQQSVTILDTLLFKVAESYFIVPICDINICSQITSNEIELRRHTATLPFNNQLIPFIDIREKFHIAGAYGNKIKVVVVKNNDHQLALLTDSIVGEHQAVLKPLGKSLRKQEYITSASQLGDGHLAFMLDTGELLRETEMKVKKIA